MAGSPGRRRGRRLRPGRRGAPQEPVGGDLRRAEDRVAPRREGVRDPRPQGGADRGGAGALPPRADAGRRGRGCSSAARAAMAADWKPELRLAVEIVFPTWLLLRMPCATSRRSGRRRASSSIETVLGGTDEALQPRDAWTWPSCRSRPGTYLGDRLMRLRFVACGASRPPAASARPRRSPTAISGAIASLVIRDSGSHRTRPAGWTGAEQRWTVSHKATSIRAATMGLGFAWFPEENIREELAAGLLSRCRSGGRGAVGRSLPGVRDRDYAERDVVRLARDHPRRVGRRMRGAAPAG